MRRRLGQSTSLILLLTVAAAWVIWVPVVAAGNPCFHGFAMPTATTATGTQVALMPCAFAPTVTNVAAGASVTFTNGSQFTHLITGANQAWGSPDAEIRPGQTLTYRFDQAGTYPYACALHPGMSGTIVVGGTTAAAAGGGTSAASTGSTTDGTGSIVGLLTLGAVVGAMAGGLVVGASMRRRGSRRDASGIGVAPRSTN